MAMIWWALLGALALVPLLVFLGRRNERALWKDWNTILSPHARRTYEELEERLGGELTLLDVPFDRAQTLHAEGSADALRVLDIGLQTIARYAPDMTRLLMAIGALSRMVSAMVPLAPLRPRDFRLAQLVQLAHLNRVLHHLLVTTVERFRLRTYLLARGFGIVVRYAVRSRERLEVQPTLDEEWRRLEDLRLDVHTLTDESLESFRALVVSLSAERR